MTGEGEIRRARGSYVEGLIELDEFESRVGDVVFGRWSPTSLMAAALKETWSDSRVPVTDAPGGVMVYRPVS